MKSLRRVLALVCMMLMGRFWDWAYKLDEEITLQVMEEVVMELDKKFPA